MNDELDEIRKRRLAALQNNQVEENEEAIKHRETQTQVILRRILTDEAKTRLQNLKLARPEVGQSIEAQLINWAQSGRIQSKITDSQLRDILQEANKQKRDTKITFRRV
jgi:programmed cell death protein 5